MNTDKHREQNRNNMRQRRAEWKLNGLCTHCGLAPSIDPIKKGSRCRNCLDIWMAPENRDKRNAALRRYYYKCREACFARYGRRCQCCEEANSAFLELDHVNDDGNQHRQERGGKALACWLVSRNFPADYEIQVLCRNCNWAKFKYGKCPHQA